MGYRRRRLSVCVTSSAILVSVVSVISFVSLVSTTKQVFAASATVLWTTPGDDGALGRASQYGFRISANAISGTDTVSWWNAATIVNTVGKVPGIAGTLDSLVLTGLVSGTRYYAILRTADEVPNWSGFSNVATIRTLDSLATVVGTLAGTVVRTTDASAVSDAEISLVGTALVATTGADGKYLLTAPAGTVTVRCERAGLKPSTQTATISTGQLKTVYFSLAPAVYYDDAQTDMGWSLSAAGDDATTGQWVRAAPLGTTKGTVEVQPSSDHTPGAGTACFVTGNGTNPPDPSESDVDGGRTTLTSPALHLSGMSDPRIVYWRWFSNDAGLNPGEDPFVTQISNNGGTWVTVSNLYTTRNYWERMEIPVKSYFFQPGDVRVRFIAMDLVNASIVEAAIDDLEYYSGTTLTAVFEEETPAAPALVIGAPRPSPSRGPMEINLELPKATSVAADVFNVQGRLVRTLERRVMPAGRHILRWDGRLDQGGSAASGVYWIRIGAGDIERRFKFVVVR